MEVSVGGGTSSSQCKRLNIDFNERGYHYFVDKPEDIMLAETYYSEVHDLYHCIQYCEFDNHVVVYSFSLMILTWKYQWEAVNVM